MDPNGRIKSQGTLCIGIFPPFLSSKIEQCAYEGRTIIFLFVGHKECKPVSYSLAVFKIFSLLMFLFCSYARKGNKLPWPRLQKRSHFRKKMNDDCDCKIRKILCPTWLFLLVRDFAEYIFKMLYKSLAFDRGV